MKKYFQHIIKEMVKIVLISGLFLTAFTLSAQTPVLKSEQSDNGETKFYIENAKPGHWYLFYQTDDNGNYTFLDGIASSSGKAIYGESINIEERVSVFEYTQLPDPVPEIPNKANLIQKRLE